MFGTIRKHQKWLWAVIITVTIVTFVIYFGPQSRVNSNVRYANHGSIDGRKITDQDFLDAWREVHLHHFVMSGRWPEEDKRSGFDPERETYQWLLVTRKQEELGIQVGDQAAQQMARQMLAAFERNGVSSPQVFFDKILGPKGYQVDDFERFVRHFVGIQELINAVGLSGKLIPPDQAKTLYQRDHQELATDAVFFWATNYEPKVQVPSEALTQFYTNREVNYTIPERVQVAYVRFNITNFLPQAQTQITNLNEIVDANYQRMGTNLPPEQAKAKLKDQLIRQEAIYLARTKATAFADVLFDMNAPKTESQKQVPSSGNQPLQFLKQLAESNSQPVEVSAPFDRDSTPKDLEVGPEFAKAAFTLNPEEPFSQPVIGEDGVYVMALDKKLPRETPPLDQIRDRVTADYKHAQAMRMAQQDAAGLAASATNGLAQGKSFTNICAEANVNMVPLPPFSISTRSLKEVEDIVPLSQLKQVAFGMSPGKVAPVPTSEGAIVLYVKAKLPLDPANEAKDLPSYLAQLRRTRQQEAFDEWLRRQAETGLRDTPLGRAKPPPVMGAKSGSAS
jgi:SurA N-terminal domain/PPIC-type PPIASE domain